MPSQTYVGRVFFIIKENTMAKLKLIADPTFQATVKIPLAGAEPYPVVFTFKHRERKALDAWVKVSVQDTPEIDPIDTDLKMVKDVATGWDLEDAFTDENITQLLNSYAGSAMAIYQAYLTELRLGKQKN